MVLVITGLPLSAFIICVFLCILFHREEAVKTHCNVSNWIPSVSAAVASFSPERYIWRLMVSLHSAPRFILALASRNFLLSSSLWPTPFKAWFFWTCNILCIFQFIESGSLLLLTMVSSDENLLVHVMSFMVFTVSALLHMFSTVWLFDLSGRRRSSILGEKSYQYKVFCSIGASISVALTIYFYIRHNKYCEPGMYSLFALSEYALIIFNAIFHSTLFYDFHSRVFTLSSTPSFHYDVVPDDYEKQT